MTRDTQTAKRERTPLSDSGIYRFMRENPLAPTRPEISGLTLGGGIGVILVWVLQSKGITVPDTAAAAIGTVTAQVVHYLISFLPNR